MSLSQGAKNILNILAEVTHNNTGESVFEDIIVSHSGLPVFEVQNYLRELQSRGLANAPGEQNRPKNAPRLWAITEAGIKALEDQDLK